MTATQLVRYFVDVVSKNGNLLLGIGPDRHGRFPAEQLVPLRGLGSWLQTNGEAIFRTRPWTIGETATTEGAAVRFTQCDGSVNAIVHDLSAAEFGIRGVDASDVTDVRMLGLEQSVEWDVIDGMLQVRLPGRMPVSPAYVFTLGRGVRPA